jgi:hypothetical protein
MCIHTCAHTPIITYTHTHTHTHTYTHSQVGVGLAAHKALVDDLNEKAHPLFLKLTAIRDTMHYLTTLQDSCLQDLICPHCISVFVDPVLCWPCGHSCCSGCVQYTKIEARARSGGSKSVIKKVPVCPECKSQRDTLLISHGTLTQFTGDGSRPINPLIDEVEGFIHHEKQHNGVLGSIISVFSRFLSQLRGVYGAYSDTVGALALNHTEEEVWQRLISPLQLEGKEGFIKEHQELQVRICVCV